MSETETETEGEIILPIHAPPAPTPAPPPPPSGREPSSHPGGSSSCGCQPPPQRRTGGGYCCNIPYPSSYNVPVNSTATIHRIPVSLRTINHSLGLSRPIAVAIGPFHHGSPWLQEMEEAKRIARDEFCRVARQRPHEIQRRMIALTAYARQCYGGGCLGMNDDSFAEMMFMDGCFLLQFMASTCPGNGAAPAADGFWARVHASVDAVTRDILLLENQLPWLVLQTLRECTPAVSWPVLRFLDLMACVFDVGKNATTQKPAYTGLLQPPPPPHLLGLFHRRQVGEARTENLHLPTIYSLSSTAVELAEMGVKLTASKAGVFGDMTMTKRRRRLGVFGELALSPVVLNNLTTCWIFNMVAHETCLGAAHPDNFAVCSYTSAVSLLMNRREDVQELRGKGIVVSALCDKTTLYFFKELAAHVRVGYRYFDVLERLQGYCRERWVWIAVHGFLYRNLKTIVALLSVVGVLAGLFKTILSVQQPQVIRG